MEKPNATRGYGLLERFLSKKRAEIANQIIPSSYRKGRILDIGCGVHPLFLINTNFHIKYGIDKSLSEQSCKHRQKNAITLISQDVDKVYKLSLEKNHFAVVTMLATFEHIQPKNLVKILSEVYRVLKPGGIFIMTTPSPWTDKLLRYMAKLRLVSPVEIEDHKHSYSRNDITLILQEAGFSKDSLKSGYFELFMNVWITGKKNKEKP